MISLIRQFQGQEVRTYIPVKEASKLFGYSQQYLRRLLRQGKLREIKVGQVWLLEVISLDTYLDTINRVMDRRYGSRTKGSKTY
jgi:excisionase family DNA binding protein